jgi:hypothetical protein
MPNFCTDLYFPQALFLGDWGLGEGGWEVASLTTFSHLATDDKCKGTSTNICFESKSGYDIGIYL